MNFDEYAKRARGTRVYNPGLRVIYPTLGLAGETGEVVELVKKSLRPGGSLNEADVILELGDVLWYISALADDLDVPLEEVAERNIEKLRKRHEVVEKAVEAQMLLAGRALSQADGAHE